MQDFFKSAVLQILLTLACGTVFCLLAVGIFAIFIQSLSPSDTAITLINQMIKCLGVFLCATVFLKGERVFYKGLIAGVAYSLFTALVFGLIGGFHFSLFFLLSTVLCAIFGALGGLCGKKLRKE